MLCTLQKLQNLLSVTSLQLMSVAGALPVTFDAGTTVALVFLSEDSLSNSCAAASSAPELQSLLSGSVSTSSHTSITAPTFISPCRLANVLFYFSDCIGYVNSCRPVRRGGSGGSNEPPFFAVRYVPA